MERAEDGTARAVSDSDASSPGTDGAKCSEGVNDTLSHILEVQYSGNVYRTVPVPVPRNINIYNNIIPYGTVLYSYIIEYSIV